MKRSKQIEDSVPDAKCAAQQSRTSHAPRPLPLFLELVRIVSETQPALAAKALDGLARYETAPRDHVRPQREIVERLGPAALRDCGGDGRPVVLIPSLINPPNVLDLDPEVSLASAVARMGRRALLLDWGPAQDRSDLDLAGHVSELLVPLIEQVGERPALVGYCLGGTLAIAAANLAAVDRVATLAAPWRFSGYDAAGRDALSELWKTARDPAERLGALPMEVMQAAFWSLDPTRTVEKFAKYAETVPDGDRARRFVALEDWANEGEPLPLPAARELIEDLFGADGPSRGCWRVQSRDVSEDLPCPALHIVAAGDRIAPPATAARGRQESIESGHVGMVIGSARDRLHSALRSFLGADPTN